MVITPFNFTPKHMTIECVIAQNFWINIIPPMDGMSNTVSPRTIVTGLRISHGKHLLLEFGSYAQVHDEGDNSMRSRTTGAIALRPMGN